MRESTVQEPAVRSTNRGKSLVWLPFYEAIMRYGLALVAVAAGMGLRLLITAGFGPGLPDYITFYPMVMLAALFAGFWPGVVATAASGAVVAIWILPAIGEWTIAASIDRVGLALFLGMGLFMSVVAELYRGNRDKAAAYDRDKALRESEAYFHQIIESLPIAVYTSDTNGHLMHFNPATSQLIGGAPEIGSGKWSAGWKLYRPDGASLAHDQVTIGAAPPEERGVEAILERPDGRRSWVIAYPQRLYDKAGKVIGNLNILVDITERKSNESLLLESQRRYADVVESAMDAIITIDANRRILLFNATAERIFGCTADDAIGSSIERFIPGGLQDSNNNPICAFGCKSAANPWMGGICSVSGLRANGEEFPVEISISLAETSGEKFFTAILRDISERKRAMERLQESQRENTFLAELIRTSEQPMAVGYPDGRLGLVNTAFETLTGYSAEELTGINWATMLTPPEYLAIERKKLWELQQPGQSIRYEKEYIRKNGSRVPVELLVHLKSDLEGKANFYYAFVSDITERKKTEESLRRLNHTLQALGKSGRALSHAADEATYLREICRIIVEDCGHTMVWVGFAENDAIKSVRPVAWAGFEEGYLDTKRITWADSELGQGPTGKAIRSKQVSQCRDIQSDPLYAPWRAEASKRGYASSAAFPLSIDDDHALGALTIYSRQPGGFSDDVVQLLTELADDLAFGITTLRLRAANMEIERTLRENEQRMRLATEATGVGIWEWNVMTNQVHWDAQMFRIYGIAPTADGLVEYGTFSNAVFPEDLPNLEQQTQKAIRQRNGGSRQFRIRRADTGECRHIHTVETVRVNAQGQVEKLVGTNLDVTERKLAEQALRDADRRKDEFLAMLAHELRNPLAPIRNTLEIQKRANADPSRLAWCNEVIKRQVEQLMRLVDDLLDISRISRGLIELKKEPLEIRDFIQPALETSQPLIEARRHQLTLSLPAEPLWVEGDRIRLAQVISNLINNAAKYTDEGGLIELTAELAGEEVCIRITDNGRGIDPVDLPSLFNLFYQVAHDLDRSQGGLGIGLSLVQSLVAEHGGRVRAISAGLGQGSEFEIRLPRLILPSPVAAGCFPLPARNPGQLSIMVVDDNRDAAESLALLLEIDGHQVKTANDGSAALEMARTEYMDIIILDIGLPGMDGYEVAQAFRRRRELDKTLLIALTGYGQAEDKEKSRAAGFDAHLVKPVDFETLRKLLAEHVKRLESPAS